MHSLVGSALALGLAAALPALAAAPLELPADRPLRVGFLIVDGVYNSELMAPYDIFHHTVFHVQCSRALDVRQGVSFVHDGKALTSQGGARSYDVAMYLVDHLYGPEVAAGVGRGMVLDWPPAEVRQEE